MESVIKEIEQIQQLIKDLKKQNRIKDVVIPFFSLLVAFSSIIASSINQKKTIEASVYNSTISIKQSNFSTLMSDFEEIDNLTEKRILINTGFKNKSDSIKINELDRLIDDRKKLLLKNYYNLSLLLNEKTRQETKVLIDNSKILCDKTLRLSVVTNREETYNPAQFLNEYANLRVEWKKNHEKLMNIFIEFFQTPVIAG